MRVAASVGVLVYASLPASISAAQASRQPAPIERRAPSSPPQGGPQVRNNAPAPYGEADRRTLNQQSQLPQQRQAGPQNGYVGPANRQPRNPQHLSQWMDSHRSLPLAQQQSELSNEPGFRNLNPAEQQRMHQRLQQLNAMPAQQQQRVIQRTEAMERLAPPQRQQIRGATSQLGSLAPDRRRAVASAFHAALQYPENQRQQWINSPQIRSQFNDQERSTLNNLLQVAPAASQAGLPGFSPRVPPAYRYGDQQ